MPISSMKLSVIALAILPRSSSAVFHQSLYRCYERSRRHTQAEETQGQQGHDQEIEPRHLVKTSSLKHSKACFILALRFLLLLDCPVSLDRDDHLIFGWWWISFVGFRGWKIYSTHGCNIEYGTNDMRRLLGYGYGRAARNVCLYILSSRT